MKKSEYFDKTVSLHYASKAFLKCGISMPEILKHNGIQIFLYGCSDVEFESVTRRGLYQLATTGCIDDLFEKENM